MTPLFSRTRSLVSCCLSGASLLLVAQSAYAQDPAAPAAPPANPAAPAAAVPVDPAAAPPAAAADPNAAPQPPGGPAPVEPTPVAPAEAAPPVTQALPPGPPAPEPAPPEAEPEKADKSLSTALWGRVTGRLNNGEKLNDQSLDGVFEFHLFGQVHKYIKFTGNLAATFNPEIASSATLLDGIIQFEFHDLFNIWAGRMLVPSDRANFSGTWFAAPWDYPGFFPDGAVVAPRQGPFGRNDGVTLWGQVGGGLFKYYVGAFDLYDKSQSPLFIGRLNLSLLNPEPGYYHSSTYYGTDILAIGVGAQSKKDGSVGAIPDPINPGDPPGLAPTDDYTGFNVDVLFEKNLGAAGVLDLEAAYYNFQGDYEPIEHGWYGLASYLLPTEVGIGKLQPLVRVQQAIRQDDAIDPTTMYEAQVGYVIDSYSARMALGFQHAEMPGDEKYNALYLGAQIQK